MIKTCSICGEAKNNDNFYYRNRTKSVLHSQCKDCYTEKRRESWKTYYHKHGSKYRQHAVQRNRELKASLRNKMLEYLDNKRCVECGINNPIVLEFDHIDPKTKSFSIASGISNTRSWESIMEEIDKCQILCANCHKIKTSKEQNWYKSSDN